MQQLIKENDDYRSKVLNLQASENRISPDVRDALSSDLASRYSHLMDDGNNSYGGNYIFEDIYKSVEESTCRLFGAEFAEIRPIGGHIALLASILSTTKKGDTIYAISPDAGGYPGYMPDFIPRMFSLKVRYIPYDVETQSIDYIALDAEAKKIHPAAIILGQSAFVKPYDMKRISEIARNLDTSVLYDGSHVMGLIAGDRFQPDALRYSDILFGSTHKSFFGPQGGIALTNNPDLRELIAKNLTWMTMDNIHLNRVAALGVAIEEMLRHGKDYAASLSQNSAKMGKALHEEGVPALFSPWFSKSHQVLLGKFQNMDNIRFSKLLEKNGIIVDRDGRIGLSEATRMGLERIDEVAALIAAALKGDNVLERVSDIVSSLTMRYWK